MNWFVDKSIKFNKKKKQELANHIILFINVICIKKMSDENVKKKTITAPLPPLFIAHIARAYLLLFAQYFLPRVHTRDERAATRLDMSGRILAPHRAHTQI